MEINVQLKFQKQMIAISQSDDAWLTPKVNVEYIKHILNVL